MEQPKKLFVQLIEEKSNDLKYKVTGKNQGRYAWYIIKIDKIKHPQFLKDVNNPSINLANYGEIIDSGWVME